MRVLFLTPDLAWSGPVGGIGAWTAELAEAQAAAGLQVHVLVWGAPVPGNVPAGVRVHEIPRRGSSLGRIGRSAPVARLRLAWSIRSACRQMGTFDVVEAPDWMASGLLLPRKRRVAHIHGPLALLDTGHTRPSLAYRVASFLERRAVRRARLITVPSALARDRLESRGWHTSRWRIVPTPVAAISDVSFSGGQLTDIMWCGRIDDLKDPWTLVDALRLLPAGRRPSVVLVADTRATGAGRLQQLERRIADLDADVSIEKNLDRDDVRRRLAGARVVVVTSRVETFSMVAAEALVAGTPVIATDSCGIVEMITSECAGDTFSAGDAAGLATRLDRALTDNAWLASAREGARRIAAAIEPSVVAAERRALYVELLR